MKGGDAVSNAAASGSAAFVAAVVLSLISESAQASSGYVTGKVRFHQKNGGYCPSSEDCTGSTYHDYDDYDGLRGIPHAKVRLLRSSDNSVLGSDWTAWDGSYSITWSSGGGSSDVTGKIQVRYKHKDGRFHYHTVGNLPHSTLSTTGSNVTLTDGTTSSNPQTLNWHWGTSSSPNPVANSYWAAWKMWNRLEESNRMLAYFEDVEINAFDTAGIANCPTSCARGWFREQTTANGRPSWAAMKLTVVLDGDGMTPYAPLARTMHELGHIADFVSGPNQGFHRSTIYNTGWAPKSSEKRPSALTEGMADFIAVTAFYDDYATTPWTCFANGNSSKVENTHCYPTTDDVIVKYDVEESSNGSCMNSDWPFIKEGRWPLSHTRFFWDIYDEVDDGRDTIDLALFNIFDAQAAWPCPNYPACYNDESYLHDQFSFVAADLSSTTVASGEEDENNAWDWRNNMKNNYSGGQDVLDEYFNNCLGVF